ncbi:uncharacterized protein LOC141900189 [Tubulanus polymorphus]|uniref:uncharacterized protein LOC141900189 n=1 Tax=Tubulanus polymorphus TaxID=672921 RepID=UPI003DA207A2
MASLIDAYQDKENASVTRPRYGGNPGLRAGKSFQSRQKSLVTPRKALGTVNQDLKIRQQDLKKDAAGKTMKKPSSSIRPATQPQKGLNIKRSTKQEVSTEKKANTPADDTELMHINKANEDVFGDILAPAHCLSSYMDKLKSWRHLYPMCMVVDNDSDDEEYTPTHVDSLPVPNFIIDEPIQDIELDDFSLNLSDIVLPDLSF